MEPVAESAGAITIVQIVGKSTAETYMMNEEVND
jgi:hypothetical protein